MFIYFQGKRITSPNNDFALDSLVNIIAHSLVEATTNPNMNGWYHSYVF